MNEIMTRLGIDTLDLKNIIEYSLNKTVKEERLEEYTEGSEFGIYIYDSYSEAYQSITGLCNCYKAYELFPTIEDLLEMEIKTGYKSLGEQIIKELDYENYGIEKLITYDMIMEGKTIIIAFDYDVLDYILEPVLNIDFIINDIDNIFEGLIINKVKVAEAMEKDKILFFDSKKDFVNHFMKDQDREKLLQYIFDYDSSNDDFINCPEDIAITYLTEELKIFEDRYYLHETTVEDNPFYKYIFINAIINDGCK